MNFLVAIFFLNFDKAQTVEAKLEAKFRSQNNLFFVKLLKSNE
jgi:hypothetical protein